MEGNKANKKPIRWNVFILCFLVIEGAATLDIINNEWLTKVTKGFWKAIIDVLSVLAIALGLASSLGAGLTSKIFYVILIVLFLIGPTLYILNMANVGLEMDSAGIAACTLGKMSESRNNRIIDENFSGYPWFCIRQPGLNSGFMIPQYTQAGLLNEMRVLCSPATIDNTPTCGNQEDYVAMGYFACRKAVTVAEKLEYILAIELLSDYEAQQFQDKDVEVSPVSKAVYSELEITVPVMEKDMILHPHIEHIKNLIHSGRSLEIAESVVGNLK